MFRAGLSGLPRSAKTHPRRAPRAGAVPRRSGTRRTARSRTAGRRRGTASRRAPTRRTRARSRPRSRRPASSPRLCRALQQIVRERRRHRRHGQEERELRGRRTIEADQHGADDGRARTRHAGNQREGLAHADRQRARRATCGRRSARAGAGRKRSTTSITMPPTMKLTAMTVGRRVQDALHVAREQRARHGGRQERDENHEHEVSRVRVRRQSLQDVDDLRPDTATSPPGSSRAGS